MIVSSFLRPFLLIFIGMIPALLAAQADFNRPESAIYSPEVKGYFISNVESGEFLFQPSANR